MESSFVTLLCVRVGRVPFHLALHYEYFMLCLCILGTNQPDCYHLWRLLTGYSNHEDFWSNDLPSLSQAVLNGPLLWVLWRTVGTRDVTSQLSRHSNVYGWFRTARNWWLPGFVPHKQMYSTIQCSAIRVTGLATILHITLYHYTIQLHSFVLPAKTIFFFGCGILNYGLFWIALCTGALAGVLRS